MQSILEALFAGILKSGQKGFLSGGFATTEHHRIQQAPALFKMFLYFFPGDAFLI